MRTIYSKRINKENKELHELLEEFIYLKPYTYYSDNNEIQCPAGYRRSLSDILLFANHYYNNISIKDIINSLHKINKIKLNNNNEKLNLFCHICEIVGDYVVLYGYVNDKKFIENTIFTTFNYEIVPEYELNYIPENSKYSFNDLINMIENK